MDSLALFSNDGGAMDGLNNDAYFNSLVVETGAGDGHDGGRPGVCERVGGLHVDGAGFDPWNFRGTTENSDGFAGRFNDENTDGASNAQPGPGQGVGAVREQRVGARGCGGVPRPRCRSRAAGRTLSIAENGGVATGGARGRGRCGRGNFDASDYAMGAVDVPLYFQGGDSKHRGGRGGLSPAGFTFDGVTVKFIFTGAGHVRHGGHAVLRRAGRERHVHGDGTHARGSGAIEHRDLQRRRRGERQPTTTPRWRFGVLARHAPRAT
ncbi:MAG: hypothetical protein R3B49_10820 [Phycisphaerales bacterium]